MLLGRASSTWKNYERCLAQLALHYNKSPELLDKEEIESYLYEIKISKEASQTTFKHVVYGLRLLHKALDIPLERYTLPSIKRKKELPLVLSYSEVKKLINTPKLLKHRLMIGLLYGCGLRAFELCNLRVEDLDLERGLLVVRKGKCSKDRCLPLGDMLTRGLSKYISLEKPREWLFNGYPNNKGGATKYNKNALGWMIRELREKTSIKKKVSAHVFRHSFATHALEFGMNILSVKELLGHSNISTTMIYLQLAQRGSSQVFSPIDKLFDQQG